ncbi:MAG: cyclic pyranopterin monophosphate synthase MoaC [Thermoplasmata archaeon]|nr:cyclic pyranopterin monophosphate synthase MoaC [Thermoplasmata archaeon]
MAAQRRVHAKPSVYRRAVARGSVRLGIATCRAIRARSVEKGDPIATGEVAGLAAMKRTSDLIPHCHSVAMTGSRVSLTLGSREVRAEAEAETVGPTGVEMEALVGVTLALLTVWDMVKYLEKDASGLYPSARLTNIRVVTKEKRALVPPR